MRLAAKKISTRTAVWMSLNFLLAGDEKTIHHAGCNSDLGRPKRAA